jgi:hypothetical protein
MELNKIALLINYLVMNILRNSLIFLSLIILINGSCKKQSGKDLSLTVKEYQKLGMPDHNKIWSIQDYTKALTTLSNLRLYNPLSFPRKYSKKSGSVFNRFIDTENLSFINDKNLSLSDKALQVQYFAGFQNDLRRMYTDELKSEQYYAKELIDIDVYGLSVYKKMFDVAGEIMKSNEESVASMKSGLKAVQFGYVRLITIIIGEQVKSGVYQAKDLETLSMEVSNSLIENLEWIEPPDRQSITLSLQSSIDKFPSEYIKDNYQKALEKLSNKE